MRATAPCKGTVPPTPWEEKQSKAHLHAALSTGPGSAMGMGLTCLQQCTADLLQQEGGKQQAAAVCPCAGCSQEMLLCQQRGRNGS